MPIDYCEFKDRLNVCDQNLTVLFEKLAIGEKLKQQIQEVKNYYKLSYIRATSAKALEAIAGSYELFVDQLIKIKNGVLNSKDALAQIESAIESRKIKILFHNLAKACEIVFWAATTFSLWAGIFGLALPVLIVQPLMGVALGITIIGAMLAAGYKGLSCFAEFKSLTRHDAEYTNEVNLVSFFKPLEREQEKPPLIDEELDASCTA